MQGVILVYGRPLGNISEYSPVGLDPPQAENIDIWLGGSGAAMRVRNDIDILRSAHTPFHLSSVNMTGQTTWRATTRDTRAARRLASPPVLTCG